MKNVSLPDDKIVAVLHDILEDTDTSEDELITLGFHQIVVDAIHAVTKKNGENRFQAVQRTVKNPIACEVKLADLNDNMDLSRLKSITAKDMIRYKQYEKVQAILTDAKKIYQHLKLLDLDYEYPHFHYKTLKFNYQYILNGTFDVLHYLGGKNINSPQEWWILFEDVSHYFAFCKRKKLEPKQVIFLHLINMTDHDYFGNIFQKDTDQALFIKIFKKFTAQHFS